MIQRYCTALFPALLAFITALSVTGCQTHQANQERVSAERFRHLDTLIASRNTQIPVTLTQPAAVTGEKLPLVVMLHGHGGSRGEAGGFTKMAEALAAAGIASVRMDFAGCGDSLEPFRNQSITSMLADAKSASAWAIATANIDTNRLALMGFSMGGRLAMTLADTDARYKTIGLWAPSADAGASALFDFFGGKANFEQMEKRARDEGFAPFTTTWGQDQELSARWFSDMQRSKPLERVKTFTGALFVLYGSNDTVVPPAEAERVISSAQSAASKQRYIVKGADHGLGLFSNEPHLTKEAVSVTAEFFAQSLL